MNGIKALKALVTSLKTEEIKICQKLLHALDTRKGRFESPTVKLFNALCTAEGQAMSSDNLEYIVYGQRKSGAFLKLQIRLRDKILDSLTMDLNIERSEAYSNRSKTLYSIRKVISVAQILLTRKLSDTANSLLESVIENAIKYEHYEECLTAIRIQMGTAAFSKGIARFEKLKSMYREYEGKRNATVEVEFHYNWTIANLTFKTWDEEKNEKLKELLFSARELFNEHETHTIKYYLKLMETQYYQFEQRYDLAADTLRIIVELTKNNPVIATPSRHASALINLSQNYIYQHRFRLADEAALKASRLLMRNFLTEVTSNEYRFYAAFYSGYIEKAQSIITSILSSMQGADIEFQIGKWEYLNACTLFLLQDYIEVDKVLLKINPIELDKEGWNTAIRILMVMNDIEREKLDQANVKIENLRKHIKAITTETKTFYRSQLTYEVLRELSNNAFNFVKTQGLVVEQLNKLKSFDKSFRWQILSPELLVFQDWFLSKTLKQTFKNELPIPVDDQTALRKVI